MGVAYLTFFICLIFIFICLYIGFARVKQDNEKIRSKWDEEHDKFKEKIDERNEFVFESYRGYVIPMRRFEKELYWDKYNREQKNDALDDLKKALKQGRVKQIGDALFPSSDESAMAKMIQQYNEYIETLKQNN